MFKLYLSGTPRLEDDRGRTVTLGKKQFAVVVYLAVSRGCDVKKSRLRELLWGRSGVEHGRDSLKKALQALRQQMDDPDGRVLESGRKFAKIPAGTIWIDVLDGPATGLQVSELALADLSIGEEAFDDWLQDWSTGLRSKLPASRAARTPVMDTGYGSKSKAVIGVRWQSCLEPTSRAEQTGLFLMSELTATLSHMGLFDVRDLRGEDNATFASAELLLNGSALALASDCAVIQLNIVKAGSGKVIWSSQFHVPFAADIIKLASETAARAVTKISAAIKRYLLSHPEEDRAVTRLAMTGIEHLFRLGPNNDEKAAEAFREAIKIEASGPLFAWYAFLMPFRYERDKGRNLAELKETAELLINRSLELDPFNPVSLALLAHVRSFLFRDYTAADELLAPFRGSPPNNPMFDFSNSMLRFYQGDLDAAKQSATRAMAKGVNHPYSYAFSTSLCMVDLVFGEIASAVAHGKRAMAQLPTSGNLYQPTLRYLSAAQARAGDLPAARETWRKLQSMDPNNSIENLREAHFPVPSERARDELKTGYTEIIRAFR